MRQSSASELAALLAAPEQARPLLLDVREPWEFETCRIPGSVHIPMREVPARYHEIDPGRTVVVVCHHGVRSMQVAMFLAYQGFEQVVNLHGGIDAWSRQVDASVPTY
ncbi:MAG: sulfurtransferase [Burkholderiaceae bacterium]|nr:sulfurtransferase [Burkholderiaceae bacterium]